MKNKLKILTGYFKDRAVSIDNFPYLKRIFKQSLAGRREISFYDWECPPRQIKTEKNNFKWVNFDVDLKSVVSGKKLDEYTELPKIILRKDAISDILKILDASKIKYRFYMLVADTNPYYLYPDSMKKIGRGRLKKLATLFRDLLQKKADAFYGKGKIMVILYTDLQKRFKQEYERCFHLILEDIDSEEFLVVPKTLLNKWQRYLVGHVGLTKDMRKQKQDLLKRTIASYAAEGIIFDRLDGAGGFSNPVWLNLDEPIFTGDTTELLRKKERVLPFPKVYFRKLNSSKNKKLA